MMVKGEIAATRVSDKTVQLDRKQSTRMAEKYGDAVAKAVQKAAEKGKAVNKTALVALLTTKGSKLNVSQAQKEAERIIGNAKPAGGKVGNPLKDKVQLSKQDPFGIDTPRGDRAFKKLANKIDPFGIDSPKGDKAFKKMTNDLAAKDKDPFGIDSPKGDKAFKGMTDKLAQSDNKAVEKFASKAHDEWRRGFDAKYAETGKPSKERIKKNDDGTEGDINVPFEKLHPTWKKENLAAGKAALEAVQKYGNDMEKAAEHVHNEWMKRNPKQDWNAAQHVPYNELPEAEKEKDRAHVREINSALNEGTKKEPQPTAGEQVKAEYDKLAPTEQKAQWDKAIQETNLQRAVDGTVKSMVDARNELNEKVLGEFTGDREKVKLTDDLAEVLRDNAKDIVKDLSDRINSDEKKAVENVSKAIGKEEVDNALARLDEFAALDKPKEVTLDSAELRTMMALDGVNGKISMERRNESFGKLKQLEDKIYEQVYKQGPEAATKSGALQKMQKDFIATRAKVSIDGLTDTGDSVRGQLDSKMQEAKKYLQYVLKQHPEKGEKLPDAVKNWISGQPLN
jgi:hypothetical protein